MGHYSIKQLELISGIKAHTIRIWEKRYKLFTPLRTDTNIRKYSDSDLKLLLNVAFLLSQGFKISKVAQKKVEELNDLVRQHNTKKYSIENNFELLLFEILSFNERNIRGYLQRTIDSQGLEKTFNELIIPVLERIGVLWQSGMLVPAHEHLFSNIVKQLIVNCTMKLPEPNNSLRSIVFFLPEGEMHEISLMYYNYLSRREGNSTIYFGQSTPLEDLLSISSKINPSAFFVSLTTNLPNFNFVQFFSALHRSYPNSEIYAIGYLLVKERDIIPDFVKFVSSSEMYLNSLQKSSG